MDGLPSGLEHAPRLPTTTAGAPSLPAAPFLKPALPVRPTDASPRDTARCEPSLEALLEKAWHCTDSVLSPDDILRLSAAAAQIDIALRRIGTGREAQALPVATHGMMAGASASDVVTAGRLKAAMTRYMEPCLADHALTPGGEALGGVDTRATVLFSDICDFTALSEELGPQATAGLLNEYFTSMVDCVHRQGGILDKFIGDALMAVFGVPEACDGDEDRAVRTAIDMLRELATWNRQRLRKGGAAVDIRVGINTDHVVWGNIGAPRRMDCTIVGSGVNLAARIEKACKLYHTDILISGRTLCRLKGRYLIRSVDLVAVRGRTEPVELYEVLDHHSPETFPRLDDSLGHYRQGIHAYRHRRFAAARRSFAMALRGNPNDHLSRLYASRCAVLTRDPPAETWDGVWPASWA